MNNRVCKGITFSELVYSLWYFGGTLLQNVGNYLSWNTAFIRLLVCLTTGPKPLPKWALHIVRSRASSIKWEYPLLSLRSSSSFLRLLPRLPVTSIPPFTFPSITYIRRQFLLKMWPIQLAFRLLISRRIFLCSLTVSNTSSFLTWSVQLILSILLQHHVSKLHMFFKLQLLEMRVIPLSHLGLVIIIVHLLVIIKN